MFIVTVRISSVRVIFTGFVRHQACIDGWYLAGSRIDFSASGAVAMVVVANGRQSLTSLRCRTSELGLYFAGYSQITYLAKISLDSSPEMNSYGCGNELSPCMFTSW